MTLLTGVMLRPSHTALPKSRVVLSSRLPSLPFPFLLHTLYSRE